MSALVPRKNPERLPSDPEPLPQAPRTLRAEIIPHGFLRAPEGTRVDALRIARAAPYVLAGMLVAWPVAVGATTLLDAHGWPQGIAAGVALGALLRLLRVPRAALAVALLGALLIVAGAPASLALLS